MKGSGTVTISFCMTLSVDIGLECWCADMQALCTNLNKAKRTEYDSHNKLIVGRVRGMNTFKTHLILSGPHYICHHASRKERTNV